MYEREVREKQLVSCVWERMSFFILLLLLLPLQVVLFQHYLPTCSNEGKKGYYSTVWDGV